MDSLPTPFDPHTLAAIGIEFAEPCGEITITNGWLTIAAVVVTDNDHVMIVPRHGATSENHRRRCVAAATRAWLEGPDEESDWTYLSGIGRLGVVRMRHPEPDSSNRRRISAMTSASVSGPICN
jgi:hypothetical protein